MTNTVSGTIADEELNAIIQIESAGNPTAQARTSSAFGLGQELNATWMVLVKKYRPEWIKGRTQPQVLALRGNASYNIEMLARLCEETRTALPGCTAGDLYLAHFLGVADAKKFFRANPDVGSASLVDATVVTANASIFHNNPTAGSLRAWASRKMAQRPQENWVAKYYTGSQPPVPPKTEYAPPDEAKPSKIDVPMPPFEPVPADDDNPPPEPKGEEKGFFPWVGRQWGKISGAVGGGVGLGGLSFFTDWKVVVALGGVAITGGLIVYLVYRSTQK